MKIGLLTRNATAWCSTQLVHAIARRGLEPACFRFADLAARIACGPSVTIDGDVDALTALRALIVRPIGRGSLDEIIFRLDLLHRMERGGVPIINSPSAIEKAVDKYYALSLLAEHGLPVPRTVVTEDPRKALQAFYDLGGDVVVKPIFGSRGIGITRVSDPEIAYRVFRSLAFVHHVLYVQEFIPHGTQDIRAFVIGDQVVAAMHRIGGGWKTNVSQGATSVAAQLSPELEELAVHAATIVGCDVAGVDIMKGPDHHVVNEVNSQPGFQALQATTQIDVAGSIVDYVVKTFVQR
jgi:RimK family alpha-L-glutamate ligase